MKAGKYNSVFLVVAMAALFISCAAAGNMIQQTTWVGMLDLAAAAGISVFIFQGSSK